MDRVQIVAYLPEYYADFIHLFRQGWWENVPRAMIQGITRKNFLAFILFTSCILAHCSKSSFFVQKFNFDFPRKLSIFLGEKLVKMLWFWTF